jgi:HD-GYP domain-containing protein (c-di-GMP phosphodiesterase class II)
MSAAKDGPFLSPAELRIGIFVIIDLPWFKHPFTLNSFKIKSEDQLRDVRALKLAKYRYDPERSDADALAPVPEPAKGLLQGAADLASSLASQLTGAASSVAPEVTPPDAIEALDVPDITPAPAPSADPEVAAKEARVQHITARRDQVANVERAFTKATAVMKNLNRNLQSRPKETLTDMGELISQMIDAFLDSPEATLHVMGEKAGGEEVYYHGLNVTILAMMLAKDMGLDAASARDLGVGAMLHDIGLMDIPDRVLKKSPDDYNSAERSLRQQHVDYAITAGVKLGLTPGALAVLAQHHEMADGSGYPRGMRGETMTPAARLVALVNHYDNLCNPADINKAITPHEALSQMFSRARAKFDATALQLMIRSLGVYPPGSIVQLSNDAMAVVTSINPKKPLRPWVLLYNPDVPKESADLLDLEKEPSINITKSIRPGLLPPKVAAYLNPRKRVTYFFDGGSGDAAPAST